MRIELDDKDIRSIIADKLKVDPDDIEFSAKKETYGDIVDVEQTVVSASIVTEV